MESKKMRLLGRWLPFDKFHSFFRQFSFSKGEILKKSWTLQWLVSAYFSFPFQPLHFGGGDVVQIGTSCFFFEVTWYILNSFHRLHHDRSCTPQRYTTGQFNNGTFHGQKSVFKWFVSHVKTMSEGHPKRSDRLDSSSPAETSFAFFSSHGRVHYSEKKIRCQRGGPIGWDVFVKTSKTHVDVSTYLRVNIQSVGHPHQVPHEPSRFATKPTRILYNDVELCVQFTSNFYTRSGWFHSPKKSSPTQDEMDQLQQAVYRVL